MKAIINRLYCGLLVPLVLLASAACAHTEAETNAVAKSMLEFVLLSVNDNLDDVADGVEQEAIVTWPSFLALGESEGWTPPEKKAAFAWYLSMLGTNDCKKALRNTPEQIGDGIEQCISRFEEFVSPEKILVLSPILLGENVWHPDKDPAFDRQSIETSAALKEIYRAVAAKKGCLFLAASDHAAPSSVDEEHLSIEGHVYLASAILKKLTEAGLI